MEFTDLIYRNYNLITTIEAELLADIVIDRNPKKIVEVGTYGGFATCYIAKALEKIKGDDFVTIDCDRDIQPSAEETIADNKLQDYVRFTRLAENYNALKKAVILESADADFVFIDSCHEEIADLWKAIVKKNECNKIVILHDVQCDKVPGMNMPGLFEKLQEDYKTELIETCDNNGNPNGFGLIDLKKIGGDLASKTVARKIDEKSIKEVDVEKNNKKTVCAICGKEYKRIPASHVEKAHGMSLVEYKQKYG